LKFTRKPNSFPLPDDYEIMTVWGRQSNTVKCSINYENSEPVFRVYYGDGFVQKLETTRSCTDVATQVQKASCLNFVYFFIVLIFLLMLYMFNFNYRNLIQTPILCYQVHYYLVSNSKS
jgi:hypothetical protein